MRFESYLTMLRWEASIASRIIRVKDKNDHDNAIDRAIQDKEDLINGKD